MSDTANLSYDQKRLKALLTLFQERHPSDFQEVIDQQKVSIHSPSLELEGSNYGLATRVVVENYILQYVDKGIINYHESEDGQNVTAVIEPLANNEEEILESYRNLRKTSVFGVNYALTQNGILDMVRSLHAIAGALKAHPTRPVLLNHEGDRSSMRLILELGKRGLFAQPKMEYNPVYDEQGRVKQFTYCTFLHIVPHDTPADEGWALEFQEEPQHEEGMVRGVLEARQTAWALKYFNPIHFSDTDALIAGWLELEEKEQAERNEKMRVHEAERAAAQPRLEAPQGEIHDALAVAVDEDEQAEQEARQLESQGR